MSPTARPTTVFTGGRVFTATSRVPQDGAVAVAGERILAVGTDAEVLALRGPGTEVVDLGGGLLVPGFQDTHVHPVLAAGVVDRLDLTTARTLDDTLQAVRAYAEAHPDRSWVHGWGWDADLFEGGRPTRAQLDALVPDRPAVLLRADGHAAWVNSRAVEAARLDDGGPAHGPVPDPPGGRIERDATGRASGVLQEWATDLVVALVPTPDTADRLRHLVAGQEALFGYGITAWQDASVLADDAELYAHAADTGALSATVVGALRWDHRRGPEQLEELVARRASVARERFRPTAVKIMHDGVIDGSLTAAMLEPYLDGHGHTTDNRGESLFDVPTLHRTVADLTAAGFQVHFHAIGDRAVRECLDALAAAGGGRPLATRPILSHVQVVHPDDVPRFARLGAVVSAQPLWANGEDVQTELTIPFLGEPRSSWQYPFGDLVRAGATLAGGSDWPVSTPDPLQGIHVAVNRAIRGEDRPPFYPEQALGLADALLAYTRGSAVANHREHESGKIEPGKLADLAVLDRDVFAAPADEIGAARVTQTFVAGRRVWAAEESR